MDKKSEKISSSGSSKKKRKRISQSEVPSYSLEQALRVPQAIADNYACDPVAPLQLAKALEMTPTSGGFRGLCGASIAYGLTTGGYNATEICLTDLGKRIVRPLAETDEADGKLEAFLQPRIIKEFVSKYDGQAIPKENIAQNVLEGMGVPYSRTSEVFNDIMEGAKSLGIVTEIKGNKYFDLENKASSETGDTVVELRRNQEDKADVSKNIDIEPVALNISRQTPESDTENTDTLSKDIRKVFVTHGKNRAFVKPIKQLLEFGNLEAMVSVEKQSVSIPVPDKVMEDMRKCQAAIIHVDAENKFIDPDGNEHIKLNDNVLIEIGAAMALYGRRFILLVKDGVRLPSNLQGLYEVRYQGDELDGDATIRLLQSIKALREHKDEVAKASK